MVFFGNMAKRAFDIVAAFAATVVFLVPWIIIAVIIKIQSPGPAIYKPVRVGKNGKPFTLYKFRSMRVDCGAIHATTLRGDSRIFPFGAFLRKTSLDELPQFWNILRGEMALIGPRPIVPEEVSYYGDDYSTFASVKPGVTGLWQVSGRSDLGYEERVGLDVFYVNNWSFWMDCFIFFRTFFVIIMGRGAY